MKKLTNKLNIPLSMAVWLVKDTYDYNHDNKYLSVTGLMRPIRQTILTSRVDTNERDISTLVSSRIGTALHDSIESAWLTNPEKGLELLGYDQDTINRILVNPTPDQIQRNSIVLWLEQRSVKEVDGYSIGGKFDMIADGILMDNKSTKTFSFMTNKKDRDYQIQGSIYRWLNQDKVKSDYIQINFIFTDWMASKAGTVADYPLAPIAIKKIPLMSLHETEAWIKDRLNQLISNQDLPESQLLECPDDELWRDEPKFKYYSNPNPALGARSTKNFSSMIEAENFKASKGHKGIIVIAPAEPKRCMYCDAFNLCTQKDKLIV